MAQGKVVKYGNEFCSIPSDAVPLRPSVIETFAAVSGGAWTTRAVADALGLSSPASAWERLRHARDVELVGWQDNQAGTIRPAVEIVGWLSPRAGWSFYEMKEGSDD